MDYDDIVIGSGLSALGTVVGLPPQRRVLVIGGPAVVRTQYYDGGGRVPCARVGYGGLGNFWHGVIPTSGRNNFAASREEQFRELFQWFYPGTDLQGRWRQPCLFVPWQPIRPQRFWERLRGQRAGRLQIINGEVERFELLGAGVSVLTGERSLRAERVWVCSGTLQTAGLLDRSLGRRVSRETVSDHVLCYLGQVDRTRYPDLPPLTVERTANGMWYRGEYDGLGIALVTRRPARFGYAKLDYGIEQRAVFGLPMKGALAKILRGASPGLIAEALYNRAGLFPRARVESVYAQVVVQDAYWLRDGGNALERRVEVIRAATDAARESCAADYLQPSRRPEIYLPVIHLHHSLDLPGLQAAGIQTPGSAVQIMDAAVRSDIGPEHHSFKIMVAAFAAARGQA